MVFISSKKELRKSVLRLKVNTRPLFKLRDLFFMHIKQSGQRWLWRLVQPLSNVRARAQIFSNLVLLSFFSQPMDDVSAPDSTPAQKAERRVTREVPILFPHLLKGENASQDN